MAENKREEENMKSWNGRAVSAVVLSLILVLGMAGCKDSASQNASKETETEIQVFIAASLYDVMLQIEEQYQEMHPNVKIVFNADSSGTLMTQIREGYACDLFFSASEKQVDELETEGLVKEGARADLLSNRVVLVALKDSKTRVKGFANLEDAESIALAGGSVPVGKYTRQALVNLGILDGQEDVSKITTEEIADALGGTTISEQSNVSKVLTAVTEGACEVGTVYYSDFYSYQDQLKILETAGEELTGKVVYPICRIVNEEADEEQVKAAEDFYTFLMSEEAKPLFEEHCFEINDAR